ncbi:hypothetical protein ALC57_13724 [Trachymyrmex cornetzi]|uniref:CHK kinase-like domain-containing protein n=1 Tax=Trachymyrmex cornetzi TaxID=471704 RepID=A0A195DNS7_9HYME|nr:hypothetical protein ALC57_13724 [Trachymyrmex cornetzi]
MALETPIWLNLSFVEKILRKSEDDNSIQIIDIFSKPATSKGDNYTSDMIRITVEYSFERGSCRIKEKKSIIFKILPELGSVRQKFVIKSGLFHTEMSMMSNTLNKMNKLLQPKYRLSGKALYVQNEDPLLLVIEDLAALGFRMADRLSGLDLDHSILALRRLARFHAASVALCEKEPKQKEIYSKGTFNKQQSSEMRNIFIMCTKALADEIAHWPEVKKYSEKIAKLSDHIYQIGIDATKLCKDEFNVINHGDFHVNNMLFRYDNDGKPIDHIFEPKQKEMYLKGVFNEQYPPEIKNIFIKSTKALADEIANWPEVKKYSEKIAKLSDHMYQIGINTSKLFEDEFNVINHGDFQLNNILFKYNNDGKPIDYILVDFQMCVYASPAFDLLCFLNSSTSFDVIEYKRDVLLSEYLDTLTTTMKQLNCKTEPPTMKELKAILKRRASFGMLISFTVLPYMMRCQTQTDLNEIISTGIFVYPKNETFKQLMIKRLPLYDKWGLLDL